jgi:hypothetical protein
MSLIFAGHFSHTSGPYKNLKASDSEIRFFSSPSMYENFIHRAPI